MVVIEGPDGAGKSTLAAQLAEWLDAKIYHCSKVRTLDEMKAEDEESMRVRRHGFIHDRIHLISETVYGPVLRGGNQFHWEDEIYRRFDRLEPLIIYCRLPLGAQKIGPISEFEDEEHRLKAIERAHEIHHAYDRVMMRYNHLLYDFTRELVHDAYLVAGHVAQYWRERA